MRLVLYPYLSANIPDGTCQIEDMMKNDEMTIETSESDNPTNNIKTTKTPIEKVMSLAIIAAPIFQIFDE